MAIRIDRHKALNLSLRAFIVDVVERVADVFQLLLDLGQLPVARAA